MENNHKLGIIVPYRNRYEHLEEFKKAIVDYLKDKNIDYELLIIQQDNAKQFNRGMLLNIGFKYAKKLKCDYVVFHDVDMLPLMVDYSYSDIPLHLATNFYFESGEKHREFFETYFGGVTMFPTNIFEEINGYSNKYWGWGYEDDDLLFRCEEKVITLNKKYLRNIGKRKLLKLNGVDACVKVKNIIDLNSSFTISVTFCPDELKLDHTKDSDEFTIFSIPGYDFAISYTSFGRYNFCVFDSFNKPYFVNSEIKTNYLTNITISFDAIDRIVKVYQDGKFIGQTKEINKFNPIYKSENNFYIGVGKPDRDIIPNWFKGYFKSFAYFDGLLSDSEILEIGTDIDTLLNNNFGNYKSSHLLKTYYDASKIIEYKLKDLSNNKNNGEIQACQIVETDEMEEKELLIPHRRPSKFLSLKHEENGFLGNKWKESATRYNQLRFINEVKNHYSLVNNDGLSNLQFTEYGFDKDDKNIRIINVGI